MAGLYSHGHLVLCVTTDKCLLYRFIRRPDTLTLILLICSLCMFRRRLCWKCINYAMESNFIWPMCFGYSRVKSSRSPDHKCCWSFYCIFGTRCHPCTLASGEGVPEIATLFLQWYECVHILLKATGSWSLCLSWLLRHDQREMMTISSHPADSPSVLFFTWCSGFNVWPLLPRSVHGELLHHGRCGPPEDQEPQPENKETLRNVFIHKWKLII